LKLLQFFFQKFGISQDLVANFATVWEVFSLFFHPIWEFPRMLFEQLAHFFCMLSTNCLPAMKAD
jgi:hypothetical protein